MNSLNSMMHKSWLPLPSGGGGDGDGNNTMSLAVERWFHAVDPSEVSEHEARHWAIEMLREQLHANARRYRMEPLSVDGSRAWGEKEDARVKPRRHRYSRWLKACLFR